MQLERLWGHGDESVHMAPVLTHSMNPQEVYEATRIP